MKRMDNRVASFAETQEGSATEWESEAEEVAARTITGMRPAGMSDENWDEEDLDLGYHPTSEIADEPPEMGDEQIEGARGAPPLDENPQEGIDMSTETADEAARYPLADEIMAAESQYGDPGAKDKTPDAEANDMDDNNYNAVIEETYYERGKEELDYDDDAPVEEDAPAPIDDQELDKDVNDDEEEDDHATAGSVRPLKGKDAPVWGRLDTPIGDRSTTDTETGETAELMKSVLLGSLEGDPIEESEPRRSRRSDRESTVLSDGSRRSRGHSSDSSRSSCRSTGSKHRRDPKEKQPKDTDALNMPKSTTP